MATNNNDGNNNKNKGTFEWEIANLDALKHFELKYLDIGGFHWKVQPFFRQEEGKLVICMDCNDCYKNEHFYICKATFEAEVKDLTKREIVVKKFGSQYWTNFVRSTVLTEDLTPYITTDTFPKVLALNIAVIWAPCEGSLPAVDAILVVKSGSMDNQRIPVNRHILAGHSAYFRNLFFCPCKKDGVKKKQKQISTTTGNNDHGKQPAICYEINAENIPNFNVIGFAMMLCGVQLLGAKMYKLNCLHALGAEGQVYRCLVMLIMAATYEFPLWVQYAEKLLIDTTGGLGTGTMPALELADSFDLPALKKHCLETLDLQDYANNLVANQRIYSCLTRQTQKLVDARLEKNNDGENSCSNRKRHMSDAEEEQEKQTADEDGGEW